MIPETNMFAPESQWLEDDSFPFGIPRCQVLLFFGRVYKKLQQKIPKPEGLCTMHWNMDRCSCMSLHTSIVANVRLDDNKDPGIVDLI